ncbi:uncharacterized protein [Argopecten irradians]|uniref:uncharacterized protein n=1 Tax=Argopecten irradians TaxID=31199 RepID=UPI003713CB65
MYSGLRLPVCVFNLFILTFVCGQDVTNPPRRHQLQTDIRHGWGRSPIFLSKLWTDIGRTLALPVYEKTPTQLESWPKSGSVDPGHFHDILELMIGSDDINIAEGVIPDRNDHVFDNFGVKQLSLDHSSDLHTNSLDIPQNIIDNPLFGYEGEPDDESTVMGLPERLKRGYNDITAHYDGSMRFRSWRRDAEFRINRFRSSRRRFRRPTVSVTVDGTTFSPDILFTQNITPEPEMSVFRALMSAALTFRRHRAGAENPFNVILDWDYENDCEAIVDIFGMPNSNGHLWTIYVRRRRGQVVYRGVCFPPERVLVRPGTTVTIQYS